MEYMLAEDSENDHWHARNRVENSGAELSHMLAEMEAETRVRNLRTPATTASRTRARDENGGEHVIEQDTLRGLCVESDKHDETFQHDSLLCKQRPGTA